MVYCCCQQSPKRNTLRWTIKKHIAFGSSLFAASAYFTPRVRTSQRSFFLSLKESSHLFHIHVTLWFITLATCICGLEKKKKKRCNISTAFLKIALCQRTGKRLSNIYSPFNTLQYSNAILWSTLKLVPVLQHKALSHYLRPLLSWWPLLQLSVPALLFMRPHIHSFLRFFSYRTSFFLSPSLFFLPSSLTLFFFFFSLPR